LSGKIFTVTAAGFLADGVFFSTISLGRARRIH
jgi:hypothetical protein